MSRLLPLLALAALLAPAGAAAARKPPPKVPASWIGVMADGPLLEQDAAAADREWDLMRANRVGFVRAAFNWRAIQPRRATTDFSSTDGVVLTAAARGLRVLPVVLGTPAWAARKPRSDASPPRRPRTYGRLLEALVARYGPSGTLWEENPYIKPQHIRHWQVWNEPNLADYWSTQPFARSYVRLLKASRRALRRADRRARVVLAGLPNRSWVALREIYAAGGRGSFDAVALHPYTSKVGHIVRLVRYARREMRRAGDRRRPVWLTELSWPASAGEAPDGPSFETDDAGQARLLRRTFVALARKRRKLRIGRLAWYTWISAEGATRPTWAGYSGLRRVRDGETISAPSLRAFRRTVARLRR